MLRNTDGDAESSAAGADQTLHCSIKTHVARGNVNYVKFLGNRLAGSGEHFLSFFLPYKLRHEKNNSLFSDLVRHKTRLFSYRSWPEA